MLSHRLFDPVTIRHVSPTHQGFWAPTTGLPIFATMVTVKSNPMTVRKNFVFFMYSCSMVGSLIFTTGDHCRHSVKNRISCSASFSSDRYFRSVYLCKVRLLAVSLCWSYCICKEVSYKVWLSDAVYYVCFKSMMSSPI